MAGGRWLEAGGWRQVAAGRWLEAGGWWLEGGGWRVVAGEWWCGWWAGMAGLFKVWRIATEPNRNSAILAIDIPNTACVSVSTEPADYNHDYSTLH